MAESLENQINELSKFAFNEAMVVEIEKKIKTLKIEKENLNNENLQITSKINSLNLKNQDNEAIKKKLAHLEICPTCLQDVDPVYKSNVINKMDSDTSENRRQIEELNLSKNDVIKKISNLNDSLLLEERKLHDISILRVKVQDSEEKKKRLADLKKMNESIQKDIEILKNHLEILSETYFEMGKFNNLFEVKQKEFENALKKERTAEMKVVELKKEIEVFLIRIEEMKERIKKIEGIKKKLDYISALESWLSKEMSYLVSTIEKNIMIKLKHEFSEFFSKWFSMLVPDNFDVRLDDDFTPLVEYQDYELDYSYLSGGERTAIALAYRLSLNQVINSMLSRIKTRGLVILDEPTDGFSEQQLDKMRDVLRQLETEQLIIVSHEQKIESFVENVIKFKKERGISKLASRQE